MRIKAWESKQAREQAGKYSTPYKDRPVAKPQWKRLSDTPVNGLSVYAIPEDESDAHRSPGEPPVQQHPEDRETVQAKNPPSSASDQLEMGF